jgi:hypothetical protein
LVDDEVLLCARHSLERNSAALGGHMCTTCHAAIDGSEGHVSMRTGPGGTIGTTLRFHTECFRCSDCLPHAPNSDSGDANSLTGTARQLVAREKGLPMATGLLFGKGEAWGACRLRACVCLCE